MIGRTPGAEGSRPLPPALAALALLAVAAAAGESAPPIPAHPSELRFEERSFEVPDAAPYRHRLSNGVVVYVAPDPALPLVDVAVALRAGEYLDPPGKKGLASLTAALLRRGGAGDLPPDAFDERADFLAAELASGAGSLRAGASLHATTWALEEALDLLFAMLRSPRFDRERLAVAGSNLLEGLSRRNDDALEALGREWSWLLHGREHFSTRPLTPADLEALGRDDLVAFHRRFWHPGNLILAVSGDVEPDAILAALERRFAGWEAGESAPWPPPAPDHEPRPGLYHLERDIPQAKAFLGHLGAVRRNWDDPESYALTVMEAILGGEAVSRIAGRLRTVEGLAYRAGASFGVGDHWPGELRIFVEAEGGDLPRALRYALEEVERLRARAPGAEELALAKRSLTDVFPLLFDTAEEVAGRFAEDEFLGRPHAFWRDYRRRIEAVTAEDVRRAAERHLHPDRMVIATAGRWADLERGDPERRAAIGDLHGGRAFFLPERDPLTLEARSPR